MGSVSLSIVPPAIKAVARSGIEKSITAQTDSDVDPWFKNASRTLLGSDPGLALHITTGVPERTCYRYAGGERPPTAHIIRSLLQSESGWPWLCALMEGSSPEWWRDLQRARHNAAILSQLDLG